MNVFHQNLAGALRDAAMDLAVQQHRIEHGADVVHHAVAHDLDLAGFLVDFQLADVTAVRKVRDRRVVDGGGEQAGLHRRRNLAGFAASRAISWMVMVRLVLVMRIRRLRI